MDLHVHLHLGGDDGAAVKLITTLAEEITAMSGSIQEKLDALKAKVERSDQVGESAIALIQGFPQMLRDEVAKAQANGATPEQLAGFDELATRLDSDSDQLAAAVSAGTPSQGGDQPGGPVSGEPA